LEAMTSMHARCGLSCVTVLRCVATFECPWKSLRNGQQPIATHARMSSSKGLEKRRQHGLASSVSFQPPFGGAWPRRPRREKRQRTSWRRSRSAVSPARSVRTRQVDRHGRRRGRNPDPIPAFTSNTPKIWSNLWRAPCNANEHPLRCEAASSVAAS
jgi:hypothetical protein